MSTTTAPDLILAVATTTGNVIQASWPLFFGLVAVLVAFWAVGYIVGSFGKAVRRL